MIKNKKEYLYYLEQDALALGVSNRSFASRLKNLINPNPTFSFQKKLRKVEYYKNCKKDFFSKIYFYYLSYKFKNFSIKLGFSIPPNVFGPGLAIVHYGTIVVNADAKVGSNCRIHVCTNIGASGGIAGAPTIGDNVYIAPGVKIFGNITIASNSVIGANAVVNKSIEAEGYLIAGIPAKTISKIDVNQIIKHLK